MLDICPGLAQKTDREGRSPLHWACKKGHYALTIMLLNHDLDLAFKFDKNGYTPLHLAAMIGDIPILKTFMSKAPTSLHLLTKHEETVFRLTAKFDQYNAFSCLAKVSGNTNLFNQSDADGNTVLHVAISRGPILYVSLFPFISEAVSALLLRAMECLFCSLIAHVHNPQ
ncbi:hypothetical protein DITRI_Ditri19aG0100600 [Diplodiscus trichospermus]